MRPLLIIGPDSTLQDVVSLSIKCWPKRRIESVFIPSKDYYGFDFSSLDGYSTEEWELLVVVNEFYINDVRRALVQQVSEMGYQLCSLVSPDAVISPTAKFGLNTIIFPGCFVGAHVEIGTSCVLRSNVVVSEDVSVGNFVTLEAGVAVRELCVINNFVTICANSSLQRATEIGDHSYLNIPNQYFGKISAGTFFSPIFPAPVKVWGMQ